MHGPLGSSILMLRPEPKAFSMLPSALEAERQTWNALVARHEGAVRLSLIARGIPADRARDLTQAAWEKLWQRQTEGRLPRLELPGLAIRQALFLALEERRARIEL